MRRFMKKFRYGEKGFTLIELLIVIAILGILAAVIIPNVGGFMTSGTLNAANTELANIKTGATGYLAENSGTWPLTSASLGAYIDGTPKATYTFGTAAADNNGTTVNVGTVRSVSAVTWSNVQWGAFADQQWIRTP